MNDAQSFIIFRFCLIAAELFLFSFFFFLTAKKRKLWVLRILLSFLSVESITAALSIATFQIYKANAFDDTVVSLIGGALQLLIIILLSAGFYLSFDVTLYELGSMMSLGYATRWILFCVYSLALNFINPDLFLIRINQQTPLNFLIFFASYLIYAILTYFMIKRHKKGQYILELPAFIAILVVIILNTILISFAETISEDHLLEYSFVLISNIITVSLIIAINFYTQRQIALRSENEIVHSMLLKQTEQYKFNKANAEMLHVKAHDLKHQVAILRKGGEEAERLLNELESVVYNYESIIMTDNPVINVIISEKWQYCVKHKIKMTCNVDPNALSKMDKIHLYAMLGNILDNAIEAVMKIKEKEKRIISLSISQKHGASIVQCYNYHNSKIELENGIPKTSKEDELIHGFGTKSIVNIAKRYGGEVIFDISEDIFKIVITILDN